MGIQTICTGLATFALMNLMGHVGDALGEAALWSILLIPAAGFPLVSLGGLIYSARVTRRDRAQAAD